MCFPARWHTVAIIVIIIIIIILQQNMLSSVMIYFPASWHRESPPGQFATANQTSPGNSDKCCPPNINQLASEKEDLFMGFRTTVGTFLLYCCRTSRYCVINICVSARQCNTSQLIGPIIPTKGRSVVFSVSRSAREHKILALTNHFLEETRKCYQGF